MGRERDRHRVRRRPGRRSDRHPRCASRRRDLDPRNRLRHGGRRVGCAARRPRRRADQHRPSRWAAVARRHGRCCRRRPGHRPADHHGGGVRRRPGSGRLVGADRRPARHAAAAGRCAAAAARTGRRGGADRDLGRPRRGLVVRRRRPHLRRRNGRPDGTGGQRELPVCRLAAEQSIIGVGGDRGRLLRHRCSGAHRTGRFRRRHRPALPAAGHGRGAHRGRDRALLDRR